MQRRDILKTLAVTPFFPFLKLNEKEFVDGLEVIRLNIKNIYIKSNVLDTVYCALKTTDLDGYTTGHLNKEEMTEQEVFEKNNKTMKKHNKYKYVYILRHKELVGYIWSSIKLEEACEA